jgi:hypothetical protein
VSLTKKKKSLLDGQSMLERHAIQRRPTTAKNSSSKRGLREKATGHLATAFGSFINGFDDAKQLVNTALAKAMYAMRTSFHSLEQWLPIATWYTICCRS